MEFDLPNVDIITVNYNGLPFLKEFFESLGRLDYPKEKLRIFFVDNHSGDGSPDFIHSLKPDFELVMVENKKNEGYAKANNDVFRRCSAEYIALLNNDTRVGRQWLIALVNAMRSDERIGIACSRRMPEEAPRPIDPKTHETSWCSGGHCLIRFSTLGKVGYFDEAFFMYGEDVDLSWRMWIEGYKCLYIPESICEHHFGKPEGYRFRRLYYHARNSILLRYAYGGLPDVARALKRWIWEAISLGFKRFHFRESVMVWAAVLSHFFLAPHFAAKGRKLKQRPRFKEVEERWVTL